MKSKKTPKFNFFKANYTSINNELNEVHWNQLLTEVDVNKAVDNFYSIIRGIIAKHTPKITPKIDQFPKWFSSKLIQLIHEKEYYFKLKKRTNNLLYVRLFNEKRKEIKRLKKFDLWSYQGNIESLIKTNPKSFFSYTKSLRKSNNLPVEMHYKHEISDNMRDTANLFAKYFSSVYTSGGISNNIHCNNECHSYFQLSENDVLNVINSLDKNKTSSPDNIPPIFFIKTAREIVKPLTVLYKKALSEMKYPDKFKISHITPIHKAGDTDNIENYRQSV